MRGPVRERDYYPTRNINDLRELIDSCVALYSEQPVFLTKDKHGEPYRPILFREFREEIHALGTALLDMGMKGEKIAVIGENSYLWFLTYMAVVNGVGVIVPLDKDLPPEEIRHLLERSGSAAIVYSHKLRDNIDKALEGCQVPVQKINMKKGEPGEELFLPDLIQAGREKVLAGDRRYIDAEIDREAMIALLFTSGTTGLAKGVMLSHRNIATNVVNTSKYVHVPNFMGICVLPMHHCYALSCQVMTGIFQGGCVAICEGLKHIAENMREARVNVMLGVPLIFEFMYKQIWKQAAKTGKTGKLKTGMTISRALGKLNLKNIQRDLFKEIHGMLGGDVRLFITGAAAIAPEIIESYHAMGFNMIQGYGMTENSPLIAVNMDKYSKPASCGPPLPGTKIRIIDQDENGIGEIILKSPSMMMGYYEDPEETAKVLKDGWLHTGDYGYLDRDGFLYITGRKKNVIITKNGKNIFPEEVELYLNQHDYVQESMVWGLDDPKGDDTVLCAEIFPDYDLIREERGELTEEEIYKIIREVIDQVNDRMPIYKWVRRFSLRKTEFEKTTTQKIKRFVEEQKRKGNANESRRI